MRVRFTLLSSTISPSQQSVTYAVTDIFAIPGGLLQTVAIHHSRQADVSTYLRYSGHYHLQLNTTFESLSLRLNTTRTTHTRKNAWPLRTTLLRELDEQVSARYRGR